MGSAPLPYPSTKPSWLLPADERLLVEQARSLRGAAAAGRAQPLLRGKHLGLLCRDDAAQPALLFCEAAGLLGAQVANLNLGQFERSSKVELAHAARMLGRLYDAVECQGLDGSLVVQIAALAGTTVYDGLAADTGLLARLALQMGDGAPAAENRRFALQALLLLTLT